MFRTARAMALLGAGLTFAGLGGCAQRAHQHAEAVPGSAASAADPGGRPESGLAAAAGVAFADDGSYRAGDAIDAREAVPLATVLANVEQYAGQSVRIDGEITDVCSQMGCWLVLHDGEASTRVTFKDYKFFVPRDATGAHATIVAQVSRQTLSEEMAKHLASESKGGDPDAATGPQDVVAVVASAVELHRAAGGADAPTATGAGAPADGTAPPPAH